MQRITCASLVLLFDISCSYILSLRVFICSITGAPQMTDVYPGYPSVTAGFNRYAPFVASPFANTHVDLIMPQMYNTWSSVETIAFAASYAVQLQAGFVITDGSVSFNVTVPGSKLLLGFPASTQAAGSGFIQPAAVVSMVHALAANGTAISGLMTWDIGWDYQAGWQFAKAVAAASGQWSQRI